MAVSDEKEQARRARADFEKRIHRRGADARTADPAPVLPAPSWATATGGSGHVRLDWGRVDGAAGYLIERRDPDGRTGLVRHAGVDVPAVPHGPIADTDVQPGGSYDYRVAAVLGAEYPAWNWSEWTTGRPSDTAPEPLQLRVDAGAVVGALQRVWWMVGSERLTLLRFGDDGHGNDIGVEFAEALRLAHQDLGVTHVRAHAILHDDNHVVTRAADGSLSFDFTEIDAIYDQLLEIGLRPVVELSFMPAAIARDADQTVFAYRAIISPPADWSEWRSVVSALAEHLVQRYGIDDVSGWPFEVWNEPNLEVFWTGSREEYLRLYEEAAVAVKGVDPGLRVGGPATAAGEWIEPLTEHAERTGTPLDFVTSHTYGNMPIDTRGSLRRHGFGSDPTWWTEWGVGSTDQGPIHDLVVGAPFVLSGYRDVQGRMEALSYWVISDHFEEIGRPETLFHNGFGLLTIGNLRKPRYWAAHLAAHQGDAVLAAGLNGDGADVLVRAWPTRHADGAIDVLVWNGTRDAHLMNGAPHLERTVRVSVSGLDPSGNAVRLSRVDEHHSNILEGYLRDTPWPDANIWQELRARDRLHEEEGEAVPAGVSSADFDVTLPMPGVVRIRLTPQSSTADR